MLVYSFSTWFVPGPKPFGAKSWFKGPHLESLDIAAVADAGPGASMHGVMEGKPLPVPIGV